MWLRYAVCALFALQSVHGNPQFGGFLNSIASDALGFGESLFSDIIPGSPTSNPLPFPTPSSQPPITTSAAPSPSSSPFSSSSSSPSPTRSSVVSTSSPPTTTAPTSSSSITSTVKTSSTSSPTSSPSSTASSTHTSTTKPAIASPTAEPSSHSNAGAIAAGVIVAVLGVVAILGLVWFFIRRNNRRQAAAIEEEQRGDDAQSWTSRAVDDDEKPLARYAEPQPFVTAVPRPLPPPKPQPLATTMVQRKYRPYRPPVNDPSPPSTAGGHSIMARSNTNSTEVSEIDGRPIEPAPVELEGCTPSTAAPNSTVKRSPTTETNKKITDIDSDAAATNDFKIARRPIVGPTS